MKLEMLNLANAALIHLEKIEDERGFFARAWCCREIERFGLETHMVQCNLSYNRKKGTIRGMHYQREPYAEVKFVRCLQGAVYDVIIDLRRDAVTFMQWAGVELSHANRDIIYVPKGFAHGYQTLTDDAEVFYQVSTYYKPETEGGIRWNDPAFNIQWPEMNNPIISEKDSRWPDFSKKGVGA